MRRIIYILCICLLICPLFSLSATAEETSDLVTEEMEGFLSQLDELLPDGSDALLTDEGLREAASVEGIVTMITDALLGVGQTLWPFVCMLLGASCLMTLLPEGEGTVSSVARAAIGAVFAVAVYEQLHAAVTAVLEGTEAAAAFFGSLVPLLGAVTLAGGGEATGAAQTLGMSMTVEALELCLSYVLVPLTSLLFALGLVGLLGDGGGARTLCAQVKRVFLWCVGLLSTLTAAVLGLQTVLATSTDSVAMRTVKYTVSGMLPIVGGTVSGALSTLSTGLLYVKSTVGVGAIVVLLSLVLPPLVSLGVYRLSMGACASLWRFVSPDRPSPLLDTFCAAIDTTLSVGCLSAVLMIVEIVFFMKSGIALLS